MYSFLSAFSYPKQDDFLIFVEHLIESIVQLSRDSVDLEFLPDNFILQLINPEMKFADVHLSVLRPGLSLLQSYVDLLYLVLVFFLSSSRFLLGYLKLLLVTH